MTTKYSTHADPEVRRCYFKFFNYKEFNSSILYKFKLLLLENYCIVETTIPCGTGSDDCDQTAS